MTTLWIKIKNGLKMITVEPILFLYMLGIFFLFTAIQSFVYIRICQKYHNETFCASNELYKPEYSQELDRIQSETSHLIKTSTMAMTFPSIIVDCYIGSWSDIFGRKVTILIPLIGAFTSSIIYSLLTVIPSMEIEWIILASVIQGCSGSYTSVISGVMAYVSSKTSRGERTTRVAIVESMTYLAGSIGPFIGGILVTSTGTYLSIFLGVGICHLLAIIYTAILLPSIHEGNKPSITFKTIFSLSHLINSIKLLLSGENLKQIVVLLIMGVVVMTNTAGEADIAFLFLKDKPLKWGFQLFTTWFGLKNLTTSLGLLLILPLIKRCLTNDVYICFIGLSAKILGLVILAFSTSTLMAFISLIIGLPGNFALAAIRAMLSQCVDEGDIGKLFGIVAVVEDICSFLGALIFNSAYPATRGFFNGTMFLAAGISLLIPAALQLYIVKLRNNSTILSITPAISN